MIRAILAGEPGPHRDVTLLNSAAALYVGGAGGRASRPAWPGPPRPSTAAPPPARSTASSPAATTSPSPATHRAHGGLMTILDTIAARKREELAERRAAEPLAALERRARAPPPAARLRGRHRPPAGRATPRVIAEIKRGSPSKGPAASRPGPGRAGARPMPRAARRRSRCSPTTTFSAAASPTCRPPRGGDVALPVLRKDFSARRVRRAGGPRHRRRRGVAHRAPCWTSPRCGGCANWPPRWAWPRWWRSTTRAEMAAAAESGATHRRRQQPRPAHLHRGPPPHRAAGAAAARRRAAGGRERHQRAGRCGAAWLPVGPTACWSARAWSRAADPAARLRDLLAVETRA